MYVVYARYCCCCCYSVLQIHILLVSSATFLYGHGVSFYVRVPYTCIYYKIFCNTEFRIHARTKFSQWPFNNIMYVMRTRTNNISCRYTKKYPYHTHYGFQYIPCIRICQTYTKILIIEGVQDNKGRNISLPQS